MNDRLLSFLSGKEPFQITAKIVLDDFEWPVEMPTEDRRPFAVSGIPGIDKFLISDMKVDDNWFVMKGFDDNGEEVTVRFKPGKSEAEIHPETIRAMRILEHIMVTARHGEYRVKIFQYDNRIIYTLIKDGRDYKFEIGWYVEDVNRAKAEHLSQCLKDKMAIMETVDSKPAEDEYGWAFNPLDYQNDKLT